MKRDVDSSVKKFKCSEPFQSQLTAEAAVQYFVDGNATACQWPAKTAVHTHPRLYVPSLRLRDCERLFFHGTKKQTDNKILILRVVGN